MAANTKDTTRRESQKAYLAKRDARIAELFLREGEEPRDIAARMLSEETLKSDSEDSAIRTVRSVVAKLRKKIDSDRSGDAESGVATNEIDALERKLKRLRADLAWQQRVAEGEPTELCARSTIEVAACANSTCLAGAGHIPYVGPRVGVTITNTPQGPMVSYKALWPAGVRQKARKDASALAEKIAELEIVLASKRETERGEGDTDSAGGLTIIESDKAIEELIERNLSVN